MKLLIHSQTFRVQPFKFRNGYVISSQSILDVITYPFCYQIKAVLVNGPLQKFYIDKYYKAKSFRVTALTNNHYTMARNCVANHWLMDSLFSRLLNCLQAPNYWSFVRGIHSQRDNNDVNMIKWNNDIIYTSGRETQGPTINSVTAVATWKFGHTEIVFWLSHGLRKPTPELTM